MEGLQILNGHERFTTTRCFTKMLNTIKRHHNPTVMTVAQGILEWKWNKKTQQIGLDVQAWLNHFYMFR
jgi:pyruvate dehydrogenase kinase 2/3/4